MRRMIKDEPFFARFDAVSCVVLQSRRISGFSDSEAPSGQHRIDQSEQRKRQCSWLGRDSAFYDDETGS